MRAILSVSTTALHVASLFFDHWVMFYGIPTYVLTESGPQFANQLLETLCIFLGLKHRATTANQLPTIGQAERYTKTMILRLRRYVNKHRCDWDIYFQPLTYPYNTLIDRSTITTPFSFVLFNHPLGPTIFDQPSPFTPNRDNS